MYQRALIKFTRLDLRNEKYEDYFPLLQLGFITKTFTGTFNFSVTDKLLFIARSGDNEVAAAFTVLIHNQVSQELGLPGGGEKIVELLNYISQE